MADKASTVTGEIKDEKDVPAAPVAPFWKRISDVIRDPAMWDEFQRAEIDALVDTEFVVLDVIFLDGTIGEKQTEYAVFLGCDPTNPDDKFTSLCGGSVFVRKMHTLIDGGNMPILGELVRRKSQSFPTPYYDFR